MYVEQRLHNRRCSTSLEQCRVTLTLLQYYWSSVSAFVLRLLCKYCSMIMKRCRHEIDAARQSWSSVKLRSLAPKHRSRVRRVRWCGCMHRRGPWPRRVFLRMWRRGAKQYARVSPHGAYASARGNGGKHCDCERTIFQTLGRKGLPYNLPYKVQR